MNGTQFRQVSHRRGLAIALLGLAAVLTAFVGYGISGDAHQKMSDVQRELQTLRDTGKAFAAVAKATTPAVVSIQVEKQAQQLGFSGPEQEMLRRFFGELPQMNARPQLGQGSGFIISEDGHIMTNAHVVKDASRLTVKLSDGRSLKARVLGTDPQSDVAVIKVDATRLPVVALGDSDRLDVGQWVLAVGNPFGLSGTVTSGIVSAVGRHSMGINDYEGYIQTDAAINPGNSGGPLVNLQGEVIGINTAIFSRSGGYMGIGFAIPINSARAIANQLIEEGKVSRGYLGTVIQDLSPELAKTFATDQGVLVAQVAPNSPAEQAGLRQGDVIKSFNGREVSSVDQLRSLVALQKPGKAAEVELTRDGRPVKLAVTLGDLESQAEVAGNARVQRDASWGMSFQTLDSSLASQLGVDGKGVVVTQVQPGSPADRAGISTGTLIREVNRKAIATAAELREILDAAGDTVVILMEQEGNVRFAALQKN